MLRNADVRARALALTSGSQGRPPRVSRSRGLTRPAALGGIGPERRHPPARSARRGGAGRFAVWLAAGLLLLAGWTWAGQEPEPTKAPTLTFGVVPQQSATTLAATWGPLLIEAGRRSGVDIAFRTAPDIPTFEQRLAAGDYDLAYMNPYHYTLYHQAPGYLAFAREKDRRLRGILVVAADSPIQDIQDLAGQKVAFPAPAAFAASVLPQAALREAGVEVQPVYVRSHDSVYLAVAKGLYPAGGGIERTLSDLEPGTQARLRVLWRTKPYTPHALAAHPRVDPALVSQVGAALIALGNDPEGQALYEAIGFKGVVPAEDGDWDEVRSLGIDRLKVPEPVAP